MKTLKTITFKVTILLFAATLSTSLLQAEKLNELKTIQQMLEQYSNHSDHEFQALVLTQCISLFGAASQIVSETKEKMQLNQLSENFWASAIWAKTGFKSVSPSTDTLDLINAWVSDRYRAFTRYYFLKLEETDRKFNSVYTKSVLDEFSACGKFFNDIK